MTKAVSLSLRTAVRRIIPAIVLLAAAAVPVYVRAEDPFPPANSRYARPEVDEVPDLQRHVLPLLGRLACNGRECHGSFQGQGGFRLSLFGYDFAADHASLMEQDQDRVDLAEPASSLILTKPTLAVDHDGGERFKPDEWEYRLLRRWIESGAPGTEEESSLESLLVEPAEIVFAGIEERSQLRVIACWSDGSREDVTPLARFRSNDDSIAKVSPAGEVLAMGRGDTHVVVFYDNGITPVPVALPVSELTGAKYPAVPTDED